MIPYKTWYFIFDPPGTGNDHNWHGGEGAITIGVGAATEVFQSARVADGLLPVEFSEITDSLEANDRRIQGKFRVPSGSGALFRQLAHSLINVELGRLYSTDGRNWIKLSHPVTGVLDNMVLDKDDIISFEIITPEEDSRRGETLVVSDEAHQAEYPGDKTFEYTRPLSQGQKIIWPATVP